MKIILYLAALFIGFEARSQPLTRDSADYYLDKINNQSFGDAYRGAGVIGDSVVRILFLRSDNYIENRLISMLGDTARVLIAHFLLTKMLEPAKGKLYHSTEDFTERILVTYQYNGLSWTGLYEKTNMTTATTITTEEIGKVKLYWSAFFRLRRNRHTDDIN